MPAPKEGQRTRLAVLVGLLAVLAAILVFVWRPSAAPGSAPSNQTRVPQRTAGGGTPAALSVKLEALKQPPPEPAGEHRNPFRYYVKPAPPPPPAASRPTPGPVIPPPPAVDPGPPPIPLKFIGTVEQGKKRVAVFSDGRGMPVYASEGELVLGQYKLVRIGVESVVMEYADGRGRQTIPMRGQ